MLPYIIMDLPIFWISEKTNNHERGNHALTCSDLKITSQIHMRAFQNIKRDTKDGGY